MKSLSIAGAALALILSACGGGSKKATNPPGATAQVDCAKLTDHVLELMVSAEPPESQEAARTDAEAGKADMVKRCETSDSRPSQAVYDCVMAAKDFAASQQCAPK